MPPRERRRRPRPRPSGAAPKKNAIVRLSGDQKGFAAPSVPSSRRTTADASGRSQSDEDPLGSTTTNDRDSPSGETASIPPAAENRPDSGSAIVNSTAARGRLLTDTLQTATP